jgi:hypothetical protein
LQVSKSAVPLLVVASKAPTPLRLPTQAGKISKIITTSLAAKGPGLLAKGDKYWSYCAPNRNAVTCAPVVAISVMRGVEVGAMTGTGVPIITFKIDPAMTPQRAAYAVNYFMTRLNKQVARLDKLTVSYAPTLPQTSLRVGATSDFVDAGGSGGGTPSTCAFDDDGDTSCTGGGSESGGGGDYPPGNNGDDLCIAPDGSRICNSPEDMPSVPVTGHRPADEPVGLPVCVPVSPFMLGCGKTPPVIGGVEELPRGQAPWFSQGACNAVHILCSAGQEPDNDRGDASTSGKTMDELYDICNRIYETELDVCTANKSGGTYRACKAKAGTRLAACMTTARRLTNSGKHVAP